MQDLVVHDKRIAGWMPWTKPSVKELLQVDEDDTLSSMIAWVVGKSAQYGGDVRLKLMAHGITAASVPDALIDGPRTSGVQRATIASQGGFGLNLCKEGLSLQTVQRFYPWHRKIKQIDILGCAAAYITPGREGKIGDGNLLCLKLAQITGSYVRASTAPQEYNTHTIDFGPWEGFVITYSPTGGPGVPPVND
jgi:hypothetical protein